MRQVLCRELVGRERERALLTGAIGEARAGRGGLLLVLGEAGVGKSRLVREGEAAARAEGVTVLRGRAVESTTTAYRPLMEALLAAFRTGGMPELPELRPFLPLLGRLIPEWRSDETRIADGSLTLLAEALSRLLRALGTARGCLVILEDLHWADTETLAILEYLADNLTTEPVLVLGTLRSEESSAALTLTRALAGRRVGQVVELSRLPAEHVTEMAQGCMAGSALPALPASVTTALEAYAEGLPFIVEELLAAWIGSGALTPNADGWQVPRAIEPVAPHAFTETIRRRARALGEHGHHLLQVAAILGRRFDWSLLPASAGLTRQAVLDLLRRAVDAQLVEIDGSGSRAGFRFRHALTRAAILADLLPPERVALSAVLLEQIEQASPGLPGDQCELAASLAEASGDEHRAAELLLESARRALARGALATAEATLDRARALGHADRGLAIEIDEVLVEVLALAGNFARTLEIGQRLLEALGMVAAPPGRRVGVRLWIARAANAAAHWGDATTHLDEARRLLAGPDAATDDPGLHARLDALAAQVAMELRRLDEAEAFAQSALAAAEQHGPPEVACEALEVLGRCVRREDLNRAETVFERAHALAAEHDLTVWRIRALHELGTIELFRDLRGDRLNQARDLALSAGALTTVAMVDVQLMALHEELSETEATIAVARRCAELARRLRLDLIAALAYSFEAAAHAKRADRPAMERAIAESLRLGRDNLDVVSFAWGSGRALASLVEEHHARARRELEQAIEIARRVAAVAPAPFWSLWALFRTLADEDGEAACEAVQAAGVTINPINRGNLEYAAAVRQGRAGHHSEAVAAKARGDAELAPVEWYRCLGQRLIAEAAIADGWGEPARWLRESEAYFEARGLERIAAACRALLRKAGAAPPRPSRQAGVPAGFRALGVTAREMEVLAVLGEGLSNREVGERLYLSPRTVEKHVASLMTKTGTRTRAQLAALAVSGGPSPVPDR